MNTLLVSYDLRAPGRDYTNLTEHLKSYPSWAKPLESVWLIKSSLAYDKVRDSILNHVDSNDKIFVVDITGKPAAWSKNFSPEISNWIKNNI